MSEVTLSPIPYDGGSLMPMNGAGICRLSAGKYFTVHAQKNPNYIFGGIWSVSGEGSSSPSATSVRTQVLGDLTAPWNNMGSNDVGFYVNCEKLAENVVLVERRIEVSNQALCTFFVIKIDPSTNQMTMLGDPMQFDTMVDHNHSPAQDGQLNRTCMKSIEDNRVLAVGILKKDDAQNHYVVGLVFTYNPINETVSVSERFSVNPGKGEWGSGLGDGHGGHNAVMINIKEAEDQDGYFFVTIIAAQEYSSQQYYRFGQSGVSYIYAGSGTSWTRIKSGHNYNGANGTAWPTSGNYKAPYMTLPRTSSDYRQFGADGKTATSNLGSWTIYSSANIQNNYHPYYVGYHALGNDDPSTFVTVFSSSALGNPSQIHTNSTFSLRVGKIVGSSVTLSAATMFRDKSFTGAHCIKGESSFEKFSEATIMQYGYQGNNFKLVYINLD